MDMDFSEIAFEAVQPMKDKFDEIVIDFTDNHEFDKRYVLIVSQDAFSESRESDLARFVYWYDTIEVMVCGPDKMKCKQLCLDAYDLVIKKFHSLINIEEGPIFGIARGRTKGLGIATYGNVPIKGYCASRTMEIHNRLEP